MTDIITMPESLYRFTQSRFNIATANTVSGASNFNPFTTVNGPSAEFWQAELSLKPRQGEDIDDLMQFILRLKGGRVLARIYDHFRTAGRDRPTQPMGAGGASTTVNVAADAAAGAEQITIKNLLPSQAVALKAMDHIGIGENLHVILNSGPSDSLGEGTFDIRPPLRKGVAEDDPINLLKPTALMLLTGGETDLTQRGMGHDYSQPITLTFIEAPDFDA